MQQVLMSKGTKTISGTSRRWISNANGTNQLTVFEIWGSCANRPLLTWATLGTQEETRGVVVFSYVPNFNHWSVYLVYLSTVYD